MNVDEYGGMNDDNAVLGAGVLLSLLRCFSSTCYVFPSHSSPRIFVGSR
jgi:hypothetical protein